MTKADIVRIASDLAWSCFFLHDEHPDVGSLAELIKMMGTPDMLHHESWRPIEQGLVISAYYPGGVELIELTEEPWRIDYTNYAVVDYGYPPVLATHITWTEEVTTLELHPSVKCGQIGHYIMLPIRAAYLMHDETELKERFSNAVFRTDDERDFHRRVLDELAGKGLMGLCAPRRKGGHKMAAANP